ncbi:E3 ubiquitin/ISG15 ligase TRIM25-like [Garra rufa]|uniref:E3 ubiquitin/ISG15 ligase TRIM25-like n=1 Tax=Garra rufa TaxID=137080 RepID=UPI003CCE9393
MAEASISQDELLCPVCMDVLKDPVTIPCGHSYCKSCITGCWDQEVQMRVYSCPQCRQTFSPRPALNKNTILAAMVEKLKKTKVQTAAVGTLDVQCDVCTDSKHRAIKSCLVCLNSYCPNHLQQHESLFKRKRHRLMEATGRLQEIICPQHDKMLEIYCRTDQQCVCYVCMMEEHKNHDLVSAAAERTDQQRHLDETRRSFQQKILEKEKECEELRDALESHKLSAQTAVEDSERIFTELIHFIERCHSELIHLIRDQEKAAVSRAEGQLERLDQEINDLRRRDAELEQLSNTQDHIQFLQSFPALSGTPGSTDVCSQAVSSLSSFADVVKSIHQLREKLENFYREEMKKITIRVTFTEIIATPEPKTRADFLQYFCRFTLDLNTVNKCLRLSEGNTVITSTDTVQPYPAHPDRFDCELQVLCRESVCGRSYWELEWSGRCVCIAVSYKSINRKGTGSECVFGQNDQSWCLSCSPSGYLCWHYNIAIAVPVSSSCSRIGVYVDLNVGTLSFYSISDTMSLIHREQATFTQPLYPGFLVGSRSTLKLCGRTV